MAANDETVEDAARNSTAGQAAKTKGKAVQHGSFKMPLWGWAVVAGGLAFFGYKVYEARKNMAASSSGGTPTATVGAGATGCVDANGNATPCPVYVPTPTATPTGNTPQQEQEYQNLLKQITTMQGDVSTLVTTLTPNMQDNLASNLNQIENDLEGTNNLPINQAGTGASPYTGVPNQPNPTNNGVS